VYKIKKERDENAGKESKKGQEKSRKKEEEIRSI
jgi:hypothetical protein